MRLELFVPCLAALLFGQGSLVHAAPPGDTSIPIKAVTASSSLKKWKTFTFDAANLIDGKLDTSWQPAKNDTYGVGQWIEVDLGETYEIARIEISQGLQMVDTKLGDLYCRNNRLDSAHIWLDDGTTGRINIGSPALRTAIVNSFYRGWHDTPGNEVKTAARRFRIIVASVLEPVDWDDLALAEVKVFGRKTKAPAVAAATVVWDKPGVWPFWVAVSNYCVAKDSDYRARRCDELTQSFARGYTAGGAQVEPFKGLTAAELDKGAFQLAFDGFTVDFKKTATGDWRVAKSTKVGPDNKPSGPGFVQYFNSDQSGDNPCWRLLGRARPDGNGSDDAGDDGSDDFGAD